MVQLQPAPSEYLYYYYVLVTVEVHTVLVARALVQPDWGRWQFWVDVENLELEFVVIAIDNTPDNNDIKTPQSLEESL